MTRTVNLDADLLDTMTPEEREQIEGADDTETPLASWLRTHDVDAVDVVGIATDYCVRATAADAVANGFTTRVLLDLTAGVAPESIEEALAALRAAGVELVAGPGNVR